MIKIYPEGTAPKCPYPTHQSRDLRNPSIFQLVCQGIIFQLFFSPVTLTQLFPESHDPDCHGIVIFSILLLIFSFNHKSCPHFA